MRRGRSTLARLRRLLVWTHWPVLLLMVGLMAVGVLAIRVCELAEGARSFLWGKQIIFSCVGAAAFLMVSAVPYPRIGRLAYVLFGGTLALLVAVLLPAVFGARGFFQPLLPTIRNSHRWIDLTLGHKWVLLQPSEIAKLTYVLLLAWYLRYRDHYRRLRGLAAPFVLTLVPMGLILPEPDLGTSLLLLPTLYIMLFLAGAKLRHLLGIVAVATVLILLPLPRRLTDRMRPTEIRDRKAMAYRWNQKPWTFHARGSEYVVSPALLWGMAPHQLRRIEGWLRQDDQGVAQGAGYQLCQSKMILGTGRWFGRGGWGDADAYFYLLPDDHTDFIFSVIGGQWGFAGCAGVLLLYGLLLGFGIEIASSTDDPLGRLLAGGVLALLFSQVCINVGMTMGLMPITGMTLPLISYGGSSLVVNCAALGLLVNVARHRPILLAKRPFEYGRKRQKRSAWARREAMDSLAPPGARGTSSQTKGVVR